MPGDSKKNHNKKDDNEPKDQRKPRSSRRQAQPEKKVEKTQQPKASEDTKKPTPVEPGPEFYKNLKRETDEIIKITEEANSKYKKKEIKSNWAKYEVPIDSYDEIEESENLGADYEQLMQAPLSIGGHFQFKHEKSWDLNTAPSLYDKYFEIDMNTLALAVNTIPFYQRNDLDKSLFTEMDLTSMNNRSERYKQKYFNDKKYTTPEMQVQDKILSSLKDDNDLSVIKDDNKTIDENDLENIKVSIKDDHLSHTNVDLDILPLNNPGINLIESPNEHQITEEVIDITKELENSLALVNTIENISKDDLNLGSIDIGAVEVEQKDLVVPEDSLKPSLENKNPVISSPEDLEKWLDDFLDN